MVLLIFLIISILFQLVAAVTAIRLATKTKFNAAWILFFVAIVLILYQLGVESVQVFKIKPLSYRAFSLWSTVLLSLCISIGIFYVRKIITYIETINKQRELTEKRLLNTIIRTEEKERQRFSKDLHDGLGPLLSSAKMSLSVLNKSDKSSHEQEIIENSIYVINEAITELKDISNNISPTILQNFGLSKAVKNFISKITLPDTQHINYVSSIDNIRFSREIEAVLYRAVCELINNAIKHSKATVIDTSLQLEDTGLEVVVIDNGIGIEMNEEGETPRGMGIGNITSRVESLGGTITFNKKENPSGTEIIIKINI